MKKNVLSGKSMAFASTSLAERAMEAIAGACELFYRMVGGGSSPINQGAL